MGSNGIMENNGPQKRTSKYDDYAKKSLVFGIIALGSPLLVWLSWYLVDLSGGIENINNVLSEVIFFGSLLVVPIVDVVLAILGVIFGIKGIKTRKIGMCVAGLIMSGIVLLAALVVVIYFAAGGEFM